MSNWRFSTDNGLEERPLETALRENLAEAAEWDRASTSVSPFAYLERGRYEQHLEPWFAAFPMNLQVVFLQDLLDRDEALGTLYQHLGVDPDFRPATREQLNESREPISSLPPDLLHALRTYFHDHDLALSRRLGRRLPLAAGTALDPGVTLTDQHEHPELPSIPFNKTAIVGRELEYVQQSIQGGHPASGGEFAARASVLLAEGTGAEEVLLTTSCTSALELSAMMLDLRPGDTVVVPSFTFTTTALAFARQGARLLFCDIEPRTLGLDPEHLATVLDDTVRAVVVVHYAGIACDMAGIRRVLADRPEIALIEDNAHGLYGTWREEALGSLGRFAAQSFHETKNFTCGEGGALLLNEARDVDRARVLYDKGTNRRAFLLGQVDKYSWKDTGSSFGLADVLAAYLLAQLEQRETIQAKRQALHERYTRLLAPHASANTFTLPERPADCGSAYHMFYLLLPDRERRNAVLSSMRAAGVRRPSTTSRCTARTPAGASPPGTSSARSPRTSAAAC